MPGDAYSMDAGVQAGYVHAMLKSKTTVIEDGRQMAIIFRNGIVKPQLQDNGKPIENLEPRPSGMKYIFGGMEKLLKEGSCYSRDDLFNLGAHQNVTGNVDGNQKVGCPSIVVCYMTRVCDADGFQFLTYQTGDHSRYHALLRSFCEKKPIRVFQSSKGNKKKGKYFPLPGKKIVYRYDGLYYIIAAESPDGKDLEGSMFSLAAQVFFMVRAEPCQTMDAF
jgi:SAD/SRA domain